MVYGTGFGWRSAGDGRLDEWTARHSSSTGRAVQMMMVRESLVEGVASFGFSAQKSTVRPPESGWRKEGGRGISIASKQIYRGTGRERMRSDGDSDRKRLTATNAKELPTARYMEACRHPLTQPRL